MGIARAFFGWSVDEFLESTPHEFFAAFEQWEDHLRLQNAWAQGRFANF